MKRSPIVRRVKEVAGKRPVFLLSDITRCTDTPATVVGSYHELRRHLAAPGLRAKKIGSDCR